MKYTLTGNEVVQIAESSGVIQNASIFDLIISYYEDFRDFYILDGWQIVPFAKRLYVKPRREIPTPNSAKINVVNFVVM